MSVDVRVRCQVRRTACSGEIEIDVRVDELLRKYI